MIESLEISGCLSLNLVDAIHFIFWRFVSVGFLLDDLITRLACIAYFVNLLDLK